MIYMYNIYTYVYNVGMGLLQDEEYDFEIPDEYLDVR